MNLGKLTILFLMTAVVAEPALALGLGAGAEFVPGEVLVKFKTTTSWQAQDQAIQVRGGLRLADLDHRGLFSRVRIPDNQSVESAIDSYLLHPDVESAQPNFIYHTTALPNDPQFNQLWGLHNTGQIVTSPGGPGSVDATHNPGTSGNDMGLEQAWDTITDCSSVVVAVVDSGVNYNHADLAANMWNGGSSYPHHGYDFVDSDNDPMDRHGHGTHVAGTIGAVGNNGVGTTGVCWNANIMAVRVMDATGSGSTATITQGVDFAVANGAQVINMSLGGSVYDAAYDTAIQNAQSQGVIVVVAAGNSGQNVDTGTPSYPCNFSGSSILCVAALDQSYNLASFSNIGTTSVDIGAPGVNVISEWPGTSATASDPLTAGWNNSASWGYKSLPFTGGSLNCLVDPPSYDHSTIGYTNNATYNTYKSFNLSGADVLVLNVSVLYDVNTAGDTFSIAAKSAGGSPFSSGTTLVAGSGTSNGALTPLSYDISFCNSASCSVGFQISANNDGFNDYGVAIGGFSVSGLAWNTTSYNVLEGTSMATPHVTGLAAMIKAYNPNYTAADVINAIKSGGTAVASLAGKTVTGKAANAQGALAYINAPTGVSAVKK